MQVKQSLNPGRPCTYPWDEWLEPGETTLTMGKDFYCETISLVTSARRQVRNRNLKATIVVRGIKVIITVEDAPRN